MEPIGGMSLATNIFRLATPMRLFDVFVIAIIFALVVSLALEYHWKNYSFEELHASLTKRIYYIGVAVIGFFIIMTLMQYSTYF